ncbi:hypothetical protein D3C85_1396360 [compost metagenome]
MCHGDRAVLTHQQLCHGFADNVGFTHDHGVEPFEAAESIFEHHQAPEGSARNQCILTGRQTACVQDMKAVNIFVWINGVYNGIGVQVRRQRQLHQNAIHFRSGI